MTAPFLPVVLREVPDRDGTLRAVEATQNDPPEFYKQIGREVTPYNTNIIMADDGEEDGVCVAMQHRHPNALPGRIVRMSRGDFGAWLKTLTAWWAGRNPSKPLVHDRNATRSRRNTIAAVVSDLVGEFLYYGRKESETLPLGEIEAAVDCGEVTIDEIVDLFRRELTAALPRPHKVPR